MRTMRIGCAALLLFATPVMAKPLLQQDDNPSALGLMLDRADRNGGTISTDERQEMRQKALEAGRQRQMRLQQERDVRTARQQQLVAIAPGLMTDALQRQCFDHIRMSMNAPSSLKVAATLAIDPNGSTGDIPDGQVQFATRIWGRNHVGATVGVTLYCIYAVTETAMTFRAAAVNPPQTGILTRR